MSMQKLEAMLMFISSVAARGQGDIWNGDATKDHAWVCSLPMVECVDIVVHIYTKDKVYVHSLFFHLKP